MIGNNIIFAVAAFVLSIPMAWLVSVLGHWFPLEKDFGGAVKKTKECRRATIAAFIAMPVLSAVSAYFAGGIIGAVLNVILTWALTVIFAVDFRTYEIPFKINVLIFLLGLVRLFTDIGSWQLYLIGFFIISVPLATIFYASKGRAIGFGDVKMMAACGTLIGWKNAVFALMLGCIVGSVVHLLRMKYEDEGAVLAMGPYLAIGVYIAAVFGDMAISMYLTLF